MLGPKVSMCITQLCKLADCEEINQLLLQPTPTISIINYLVLSAISKDFFHVSKKPRCLEHFYK